MGISMVDAMRDMDLYLYPDSIQNYQATAMSAVLGSNSHVSMIEDKSLKQS
jgi:hypothetical protein